MVQVDFLYIFLPTELQRIGKQLQALLLQYNARTSILLFSHYFFQRYRKVSGILEPLSAHGQLPYRGHLRRPAQVDAEVHVLRPLFCHLRSLLGLVIAHACAHRPAEAVSVPGILQSRGDS